MNKLLALVLVIFVSACSADSLDTDNSPYMLALKDGMKGKGVFNQIILYEKNNKYNMHVVEINGYIDAKFNRLYSDDTLYEMYKPLKNKSTDESDNEVSFGLDIVIKELDNYSCPDSMVRIEATYKFEVTAFKKRHHLVDIVKIYAYDTTPFHEGGTGGLIECYSAE